MIINIENTGKGLTVSHYTEEGEVNMLDIAVPKHLNFVWQKTTENDKNKDKEWRSWDNFPVRKSPSSRFDKYRTVEILEAIDPDITKPLWEYQTPKKYFVDIEVEITDNRADSLDTENSKNRVLSIGMASSHWMELVWL